MCGICCCLFVDNENSRRHYQVISDFILPHILRRGPDHMNKKDCSIRNDDGKFCLSLVGTILHLRGSKTPQPLEDECGNILLWNGEIFGGIEVKENENDSLILLNTLSKPPSEENPSQHVLSTMARVQGPWAFVYWQKSEQKLWFGRDYFGRRSLLWHLPSNPDDVLAVTSVTERNSVPADANLHFEEVPADGVYCVDFVSNRTDEECEQPFRINKFEWKIASEELQSSLFLTCPVQVPFNRQMPKEQDIQIIEENRRNLRPLENTRDENALKLEEMSSKECKKSVGGESYVKEASGKRDVEIVMSNLNTVKNENVIEPTITGRDETSVKCDSEFSGREKSPLEDLVSDLRVNANFSTPNPTLGVSTTGNFEASATENQSFNSNSSPMHSVASGHSQHSCLPNSDERSEDTNFSSSGTTTQGCPRYLFRNLWDTYKESRDRFIAVLGDAVRKRVWNLPRTCSSLVSSDFCSGSASEVNTSSGVRRKDARVGILFSGGIDSMMIAALADRFVPTDEAIDLINVAFEQKTPSNHPQNKNAKKGKTRKNATPTTPARNFSVPDRITGISGLDELQRINPLRQWNFIEVDTALEELQEMRSRHISHLVSPLNTVLDDSIGCALWFAARGVGRLRSFSVNSGLNKDKETDAEENTYTSRAKVLLVGMGADEQLGGYARHRTRFINEGWFGLMDEMEMEVKRISKRNLGRDDRCISDHGREARFPFLDEEVVSFLNSLPVWLKTDPGLPRGIGEKQLLRQAARLLGLTSSSQLPKRAIQFGSRIAKLESAGEKGSETCSRLEF